MINDFSTCVMSVKHAGWTTCMSAECLKAVSIGGNLHPVPPLSDQCSDVKT